ncbi:response regulator [Pseudobacteroides cellulosolvens]|uniref:Stage 0 sporulation protein A homolog n=1 Tax=Pseudobacteroides cellulosolvens ATCC 35603 = DSM 2933 TaxID=398512 RepID=A0A0L6JNI6_9FIRM|nr:response regulator [Pseudobacteroides cellulosolvens]KNY27295.1 response regulator receiver protein [Pseudobacteroides cellulosolvens ATCC 35603 = DSM 2933]
MASVLIVDDAAFMRTSLKMMLERNGFTVIGEAENGAMAVQKYMELNPNIVTMDITMPVLDGIEATKKIKELDPKANIIIVSAMGQEVYVRDAVVAGAKNFIVKPFKEEHVLKVLNSL